MDAEETLDKLKETRKKIERTFEMENRKAVKVDVYDNGVVDITYADGKSQVCRCEYHEAILDGFEDFEIH